MRARVLVVITVVGLALAGIKPASAQAVGALGFGGRITHALTAQVPSVVRMSLSADRIGPDGNPALQIQTNDPAIRRMVARGIEAEEIQALAVQFTGIQHSKGGEQALEGAPEVTRQVVRYTLVQP